jgi:glutamate N-acetyltransferase / amino-acid N-acetyltransferase
MGIIFSRKPAACAALFTQNKLIAAPVILCKEKVKKGFCQAVLVNSGNANCFTGDQGIEDAKATSRMVSKHFGISDDLVLVSSTGVIGAYLPMDKFETGIPKLFEDIDTEDENEFATAILTTDTFPKIIKEKGMIGNKQFTIMGIAKGSGMIRPDMATMLAFVLTDADVSPALLKKILLTANEQSFNRITVDGDTSTNDTLLCLANQTSGLTIDEGSSEKIFQDVMNKVCFELSKLIVEDGEGATKVIQIIVKGAQTRKDAFKASETIAHSNLVKTAIYGEDPNWGRITAAAGRSGAHVVPEKMDLFFGDQALVKGGVWLGEEAERKAAQIMKNNEIKIVLDLNLGDGEDAFLFCDFSENYVKINADYRT